MQKINYKYFLILFFSLIIISCSDDSKNTVEPEETLEIDQALVGTWELTKILSPISTTPEAVGLSLTATFINDGKVEFTTIDSEGTSVSKGTWGTLNGVLTIKLEDEDAASSSYTVSGNTATINEFPVDFQGSVLMASLEFTKKG